MTRDARTDPAPYAECRLCPRQCRADRGSGRVGVCGETAECRVASIEPHFGEEPPFTGTRGSGTVFFSGCSSRCFFCQNHQISLEHHGRILSDEELYRAAFGLLDRGVHNLNFVTPDHFWPHIETLARRLRSEGIKTPFLFNSSGFQDPERVGAYAAWMEIFLPDFKFADPELAAECMGDCRYPEIALAALRRMVEARGFLEPFDPTGREPARQGVLVRHLVLPGEAENSLSVLRRLRGEFGRFLPLSVMSQYLPTPGARTRGRFAGPLDPADYRRVCEEVQDLEFEQVFIQPPGGDDAFFPDFRRDRPFRGNPE